MRSYPGSYWLSFLLPPGLQVTPARHQAVRNDCTLRVQVGLVKISGPSRGAVFEVAAAFLRGGAPKLPLSISAILQSPEPGAGRDSWTIIVNADIAFAPTALDAEFPKVAGGALV